MDGIIEAWKNRAETLRAYGATAQATTLERCAAELAEALRAQRDQALTLEQASAESGYSPDHLRRLLRTGVVPNAGRRGAPRIRRADLPRRPMPGAPSGYDPDADAADLLTASCVAPRAPLIRLVIADAA